MKKSLIALAVLAASGAAMAQSSVTLYGIADVWVGNVSVDNGTTDKSYTQMVSGGVSTSRWGMKGSEDLGGGLKANFQFEAGVGVDTGSSTGFDRAANVGFSGGFGAVKLGLAGTAYDDAQARSVAMFDSDLSPVNGFTLAGAGAGGADLKNAGAVFKSGQISPGKASNQIHYQAPTMGGFSGAISYALDEEAAAGKAVTAFNLTYNGGPIGAELAYQKEATNGNSNDVEFLRVGAAYNFGVATAKVQYGKVDNFGNEANAETTEWAIGVDVPLSAALTLAVGYATSEDKDALDQERDGYGLALAYSLSKRTTVYGGVKKMTYDNAGAAADTDVTAYAIGVKHTF